MDEKVKAAIKLSKRHDLSPLRYPGGKRKLVPLIADLFTRAKTPIELLVEPFAGGSSVAISFLEAELAEQIALSDSDELVAAFWKTVFSKEAERLVEKLDGAEVSLAEWDRLRHSQPETDLDRAYKCLFLNRTSFSGILNEAAGPIGGRGQTSDYPIDCRFNIDGISTRILELSKLRKRVRFVRHQSYTKTIGDLSKTKLAKTRPGNIFWYLDPPFFEKATKLYRHSFSGMGHVRFKKHLAGKIFGNWLLSYDDVAHARAMYSEHPGFSRVNLSYNARIDSEERLKASEIVVSNIIARLRAEDDPSIPKMGQVFNLKSVIHKPAKPKKARNKKRAAS